MTLRARYDGKVFIPEGPVSLPADRLVDLEVREVISPPRGSGQAILQALRDLPPLQAGDIEALNEAIESSRLPLQPPHLYDEDKPIE